MTTDLNHFILMQCCIDDDPGAFIAHCKAAGYTLRLEDFWAAYKAFRAALARGDSVERPIPHSHALVATPPPQLLMSRPPLDLAIAAWLDAKAGRSNSPNTLRAYQTALGGFRAALHGAGLDLCSDGRTVALAAQGWAGQGSPAPATYNQRLAILSSFYAFGRKRGLLDCDNPVNLIERRPVQAYATVSAPNVRSALASIDRSDLAGLRDYAILAIALTTGRRVAELAGLRWRDLHVEGERVKLSFARTKGGKTAANVLPGAPARALMVYLAAAYGAGLGSLAPDAPIWLRLDRAAPVRAALSTRSLETIAQSRLGVHFHALRHTFAKTMEASGAKVSEIQAQLGHENLQTTGRYLAALRSAENAHGEQIAAALGIE